MINETNANSNANAFFDVKPGKNSAKQKDNSYEAVMQSTLEGNKPEVKVEAKNNPKPKLFKMDKPKIGNREPFFPEQPMPYHPEMKDGKYEEIEQVSDDLDSEELMSKIARRNPNEDDREGLMGRVYNNSVFTYPVKQVAQESLDDEVIQSLMAQGLWNTQGSFMAQPSEKMQSVVEIPVAKPVAQFMASMENELGVSPDRLVQAYSELPEGQLQKTPVETMGAVIKKLELSNADEKKATELYGKMLAQMQQLDQHEQNLMVQDQEAKELLAAAMLKKAMDKVGREKAEDFGPALPQQSKMENSQNLNQQNQVVMSNPSHSMAHQEAQQEMKQEFGKNMSQKQETKMDAKIAPQNPELAANQLSHKTFDSQLGQVNNLATGEALAMNAADGKANRAEAIQSVINNAQALSQKGGGEMKMILKPEHLGEIQLKVSMQGNQVNVSMVAEKPEAKKLLEQNIQELKHGLATHNLSMEKVDVSLSDKSQSFQHQQNGRPDFNQAKEFAQQFSGHANQGRTGDQKLDDLRAGRIKPRSMLTSANQNKAVRPQRSKLDVVA